MSFKPDNVDIFTDSVTVHSVNGEMGNIMKVQY